MKHALGTGRGDVVLAPAAKRRGVTERESFKQGRVTGNAAERGAGDHGVRLLVVSIANPSLVPPIAQVALERLRRGAQLVAGFDTLRAVAIVETLVVVEARHEGAGHLRLRRMRQ